MGAGRSVEWLLKNNNSDHGSFVRENPPLLQSIDWTRDTKLPAF